MQPKYCQCEVCTAMEKDGRVVCANCRLPIDGLEYKKQDKRSNNGIILQEEIKGKKISV